MPLELTYPGVFVQEIPSGVRTITGVSTANTAFVDFFPRGPLGVATRVTSFAEFARIFGGIDTRSEASYGISQYFLNGGTVAWVVRVAGGKPTAATVGLTGAAKKASLTFSAVSEGTWAAGTVEVALVRVVVPPPEGAGGGDGDGGGDGAGGAGAGGAAGGGAAAGGGGGGAAAGGGDAAGDGAAGDGDQVKADTSDTFNVFVRELSTELENGQPKVLQVEVFRGVSMKATSPNFVTSALEASELVRVTKIDSSVDPLTSDGGDTGRPQSADAWKSPVGGPLAGGDDGTVPVTADDLVGQNGSKLRALDLIAPEIFNMLCLPAAVSKGADVAKTIYDTAVAYCIDKRAFLLVDIPDGVRTPAQMRAALATLPSDNHAAVYFPRLTVPDPANGGRARPVGTSGTMAGIYARTDGTRGVWKAPAGTEATIRGADLATIITDGDNGGLNPFGINALRSFPVFNTIVWGARTLDGADAKASEWKYVPVRRTALFIEESLFQALKWVVFEPNDEPLWAQIRLNVGAFMNDLFRQGAFQGRTPQEAYLVKCDKDTTTQNDINRGVVNVLVGFAPLKPAEFVVIKIQQLAGQVQV